MKKKELNYLIEQVVAQCLNELSYQTYNNAAKKQYDIILKKDLGKNPYKYGDEEFKRLNRLHKFSGAANKARLEEIGLDINDIPLINKELNKNKQVLYNEIHEILKPLDSNYMGFKEALAAIENIDDLNPIKKGSDHFYTLFSKIKRYIINQYILKNFNNLVLKEDNDPIIDIVYIKECDIVINNNSYHIEYKGNKIFINNVQIAPHDKIHTSELSLYLSSLNIELFDPYSFKRFLKNEGLLTE